MYFAALRKILMESM